MAFDQKTRNLLQRTVTACRKLLDDEFAAQRRGTYGINDDGTAAPLATLAHLPDEDMQVAQLLRDRLDHLVAGLVGPGKKETDARKEAVGRLTREQAFTVLNRLAALRMAEERGIVLECVRHGLQSEGFLLFQQSAGSAFGDTWMAYRAYLFVLFDELAVDLGVLFSRWDPAGLLFPRQEALEAVLGELGGTGNAAARDNLTPDEFNAIWAEDETIGWIYQYYNDPAERKKMRDESAAPRNSRELAVRNQFFTPRYVVEFLTDNTLGRIWYEMTQGQTRLKDQCRYLVRRPNEIFLSEGEAAPSDSDNPQSAISNPQSQEELLREPVFIPHRPLKDPRTILMIDPACGSLHFGLYAFDLFEVIYEEAWDMAERMKAEGRSMKELEAAYPEFSSFILHTSSFQSKEAFLRQVPRLIIEHNIHGIDIDPRCAQIAGLSLWLRAQKSWQRLGLTASQRPTVTRSNIVCAEPMPGEKDLLREFVEREFPAEERGVFLRLLEAIFDKMQLAGEAGSLLKIEEEIKTSIEEARRDWDKLREHLPGLADDNPTSDLRPLASDSDLRPLTSDFWEAAESRLIAALRDFAELAENGGGFQRRLFAEDAARGFAFIDVCRKRYDVALMNPPFGAAAVKTSKNLEVQYPECRSDVYGAFVLRGYSLLNENGSLGAITNRTGFFTSGYEQWRSKVIYSATFSIRVFADLGSGVLDSALVETAAFCCDRTNRRSADTFSMIGIDEKASVICDAIRNVAQGAQPRHFQEVDFDTLSLLPAKPLAYWSPNQVAKLYKLPQTLEPTILEARAGLRTLDNFRFLRLWWEVPANSDFPAAWVYHLKGGAFQRFFVNPHLLCAWKESGKEIKSLAEARYGSVTRIIQAQDYYFRPGLTFTYRTSSRFGVRAAPAACNFGNKGPLIVSLRDSREDLYFLLGYLNSPLVGYLISLSLAAAEGAARSYEVGIVQRLPLVPHTKEGRDAIAHQAKSIVGTVQNAFRCDSSSCGFVWPRLGSDSLSASFKNTQTYQANAREVLKEAVMSIDQSVSSAAGVEHLSHVFSEYRDFEGSVGANIGDEEDEAATTDGYLPRLTCLDVAAHHLSLFLGATFGRWDIRYATGEQAAPELPDPFAPLPVCPPGQLQNAQGLPVEKAESEKLKAEGYPIDIPWDGILVDDPNHPLDIERRVREVIGIIWGGGQRSEDGGQRPEVRDQRSEKDAATPESIEHEACEILGVKSLREYFRKPAGFFADHLKRYSKSRRQAPIYWPLSTASGSYTLWIYYHHLDGDTLYKCLQQFVEPKIKETENEIHRLRTMLAADEAGTKERKQLADAESLLTELRSLHATLSHWAPRWKPNLNDGVVITASPLWELFRLPKWQKILKETWQELEKGTYDWAHLALTLWPDRVREKCQKDRSLAIAHNLQELCEIEAPVAKKKAAKKAAKKKGESTEQNELPEI